MSSTGLYRLSMVTASAAIQHATQETHLHRQRTLTATLCVVSIVAGLLLSLLKLVDLPVIKMAVLPGIYFNEIGNVWFTEYNITA